MGVEMRDFNLKCGHFLHPHHLAKQHNDTVGEGGRVLHEPDEIVKEGSLQRRTRLDASNCTLTLSSIMISLVIHES